MSIHPAFHPAITRGAHRGHEPPYAELAQLDRAAVLVPRPPLGTLRQTPVRPQGSASRIRIHHPSMDRSRLGMNPLPPSSGHSTESISSLLLLHRIWASITVRPPLPRTVTHPS